MKSLREPLLQAVLQDPSSTFWTFASGIMVCHFFEHDTAGPSITVHEELQSVRGSVAPRSLSELIKGVD